MVVYYHISLFSVCKANKRCLYGCLATGQNTKGGDYEIFKESRKLKGSLPYRTLRCEWIILLASSGVRDDPIGPCSTLMAYVLSDELDEGERGADSDFARKEAES